MKVLQGESVRGERGERGPKGDPGEVGPPGPEGLAGVPGTVSATVYYDHRDVQQCHLSVHM